MRQRALEDEKNGKGQIMRDPQIKPRLPKRPSSSW